MTDGQRAGEPTGERSQTLDRGLALLELLADEAHLSGMTISAMAAELRVGRPVVYRLVNTLRGRGFVQRREDGRITLGVGLSRLVAAVRPRLREAAQPLLRELADTVSATAHLTVEDAGEALAIAVVEPRWADFHVGYRVGSRHPLGDGAAGRAILAGREHADAAAYVSTDGELQPGAHGLAAPVLGVAGLEASIGVVALGAFDDGQVGPHVVRCASRLARRLQDDRP